MNWGMTLFIIILSYAVSIGARLMIKLTFLKYDDIATAKKISGAEAARAVLDGRGLSYVSVERIRSELSDGSTLMRVELSESTFDSDSVAAVGMAAYQAGHVMKRADGYSLNSLTGAAVPCWRAFSRFTVFYRTAYQAGNCAVYRNGSISGCDVHFGGRCGKACHCLSSSGKYP